MIKFIIFVVAAFLLYKLLIGDQKKKKHDRVKDFEKKAAQGLMVQDPVCGTYVSKDSDIRVKQGEEVHCFCSYECRDKYLKQIQGDS